MAESVLHVENVTMQFGGVVAVNNLSMDIYEGEIVGFAGLMGAGRTETTRAIFGVDPKTSGEIWLISLAIQFALGKDLFCLPWLSARTIFRAKVMAELGILDTLRKAGKIVLLPTNQKATARRICDRLILLS